MEIILYPLWKLGKVVNIIVPTVMFAFLAYQCMSASALSAFCSLLKDYVKVFLD